MATIQLPVIPAEAGIYTKLKYPFWFLFPQERRLDSRFRENDKIRDCAVVTCDSSY
jgi:hypothetical protein